MNISFIGHGNMAKSIIRGLLQDASYRISAAAPSLSIGKRQNGVHTHSNNLAVIPDANTLIFAVKPIQMPVVLTEISAEIPKDCLIVSIVAGLNLHWFTRYLPEHAIIRAMPNIAAEIGESATPLIANEWVTQTQKQNTEAIFSRIGRATWVNTEQELDAFTALSGSGPAYVFKFMDAMMQAAVQLGISKQAAKSFTLQTFQGALHLAARGKLSPSELQKKVTSPGGTTEAAIEVLMNHDFDELIYTAMKAAYDRAQQLGR